MYRQVKLVRRDEAGTNQSLITWIPEHGARTGMRLKIKSETDQFVCWRENEIWTVEWCSQMALPAETVRGMWRIWSDYKQVLDG